MTESDSEVVCKMPCLDCGSSNNLAIYDDGHGYCYTPGCGFKASPDGIPSTTTKRRSPVGEGFVIDLQYVSLVKRGLSEETCRKFKYGIGMSGNTNVQVATYYKAGEPVAQHFRTAAKDFWWTGEQKGIELYGQHLWSPGKKLIITEGEIDCLTVSQLQGNKWPVVSIPSGAASAKKSLKNNLEWLEQFEEVILMFDMDEAGRDAAAECAPLFSPGKCKVASLPFKDANECLLEGQGAAVISSIWQAKPYRPDGLVSLEDILEDIESVPKRGLPWCFKTLDDATFGRRMGEIVGLGAGTGIGKTDFITQQIAYDTEVLGLHVGCVFLEQKPKETAKRIAGKIAGKRFHVPDGSWESTDLHRALEEMKGKLTFYDNFGQTDWDVVASKIRFMAVSQGITVFYVDHLTAMADTSNERESLEQIMKELAGIANELNVFILFISHLTTPEGRSHEEGGHVSIRHFKGSRSIGFWSYFMFGMERNQQAEDLIERQTTTFRILKDRYTGQSTGLTFPLIYEQATGRLIEGTPDVPLSSGPSIGADEVRSMF